MEDRIEIYLLEHLQTMRNCHTLAEAAEQLNITQPTLSRSIQKIERILGVELFRREHNRLYLNDNGVMAVNYAMRILDMESEMVSQIRSLDQTSRMISVGSCTPGPILKVVQDLQMMYPDKRIASEVRMPEDLLKGLRRSDYQMIIINEPVTEEGCICSELETEQLYVTVTPDHPAAVRGEVSFSDLNGENLPVMANLGIWRSVIDRMMPDSHFYPQSDLSVIMSLAEATDLPTFDSNSRIQIFGESKGRVTIPISDKEAKLRCYCVCRSKNKRMFSKWFINQ